MSIYRNKGAPWTRPDGTRIERGAEFEPTEEELARKRGKLAYVRPDEDAPTPEPAPDRDELEDYRTSPGWYLIRGERYHGAEAARRALESDD